MHIISKFISSVNYFEGDKRKLCEVCLQPPLATGLLLIFMLKFVLEQCCLLLIFISCIVECGAKIDLWIHALSTNRFRTPG